MDKLQAARESINSIDKEMARLFCERMDAVKLVAEHKREHGIPVFDSEREAEVIKSNSLLIEDEELRAYYVNYIKSLMDISKNYQHRILEGARIAYCGVEGAFAHIAAKSIFPDALLESYPSFEEAYQSVENGVCDSVVLPIENSYAGEVAQVADLMFEGSLFVNGIYDLHITHNLLGTPDADISDITTVVSHPQALSQCGKYISEKGFKSVKAANTAIAAQSVAEGADKSIAAIASRETAKLYNLKVLDHHINSSNSNTTRFAVFSRAQNKVPQGSNNFILIFTVNNEAGALAKAINIIGKYGFNMKALRSRPIKSVSWQYYFYAEGEGDIESENGKKMLSNLSDYCDKVSVVGTFSNDTILSDEEE